MKDEHYRSEAIKNVIFSYMIKDGKVENNYLENKETKVNEFMSYFNYKLPIASY